MDDPAEPDQDESLAKSSDKTEEAKTEKVDEPTQKDETSLPEPAKPDPIVPDQIIASDSSLPTDQALAVANSNVPESGEVPSKNKKAPLKDRLQAKIKSLGRKKLILIGLALVLIILFVLPFTRYRTLGIFIQQPVTVTVLDSTTATPVSRAKVSYDGRTLLTNDVGQAKISASVGKHTLTISKQYYQSFSTSYFDGFSSKSHSVHESCLQQAAWCRLV